MFKIATLPRIKARVPLVIEVDGDRQDHSFDATFQVLPMGRTADEALQTDAGQIGFLSEAIVDLGDLEGEDGRPVVFSTALLLQLLDRIEVRSAFTRAYFEVTLKAAAGN